MEDKVVDEPPNAPDSSKDDPPQNLATKDIQRSSDLPPENPDQANSGANLPERTPSTEDLQGEKASKEEVSEENIQRSNIGNIPNGEETQTEGMAKQNNSAENVHMLEDSDPEEETENRDPAWNQFEAYVSRKRQKLDPKPVSHFITWHPGPLNLKNDHNLQ